MPPDRHAAPHFIFMLTRDDRTAPNAEALAEDALSAGVRHIGFKDVGLPWSRLGALARRLRDAGAETYLEVVSLDAERERDSIAAGLELGVGALLGGVHAEAAADVLSGAAIAYFPFAGDIRGHPSVLAGAAPATVADARRLCGLSHVAGIDLLAYRGAGDGGDLAAEVCKAIGKPVIVAGSIDSPQRIRAVAAAGARAFTIGTAVLEGRFHPDRTSPLAQLRAVADIVSALADQGDGRRAAGPIDG